MKAELSQLISLMEKNRGSLLRLAMRRSKSREDAEDALQDAFVSALRHLDQFDGRAQMSSWLTRIVMNAASDRLRRQLAHPAIPISGNETEDAQSFTPSWLTDPHPSPEEIASRKERSAELWKILAEMPPTWRNALELRALEGFSTRETAEHLGVPEGTVKCHLFRAHRHLKRQLNAAEA